MDLWMQIEGTKLILIMSISVLGFFKFASRMPQIAQILVSTFKIFQGSMPPDPPTNFLFFFFHEQFQALSVVFIVFSLKNIMAISEVLPNNQNWSQP